MDTIRKDWWAQVHRGLVVDPSGKHIRRLDGAIWLLLYCFLHANRATGEFWRKYDTIAGDMGKPVRTIRAWMRRLRERGYIIATGTGRSVHVRVLRWRSPTPRQDLATQTGKIVPVRVARNGSSARLSRRKDEQPRAKSQGGASANKSLLTKAFSQQQDDGQPSLSLPTASDEGSESGSREALLAADLAAGLNDPGGVKCYRAYADQYPEALLRRLLSEVRAVPQHKIKRSRAALFRYLLTSHVK